MKKKVIVLSKTLAIVLAAFLLVNCEDKVEDDLVINQIVELESPDLTANPMPEEWGQIPEATFCLDDFSSQGKLKSALAVESTLEPEPIVAELYAGESVFETEMATVGSAPPQGDVVFLVDLTGSMGGELYNAKTYSTNIMGQINALIPDAYFGVISHMDYTGTYYTCGYNSQYGSTYYGDYPYRLDMSLTDDVVGVAAAINGLVLGSGHDAPESYTRALYEAYADEAVGWRDGSKKIVVAWLDNIPHDCNVYEIIDGYSSTGVDPGRDELAGTADDLAILDVLYAMADENITLIVLNSAPSYTYQNLWEAFAGVTGGDAFQINSDGSIPGGYDIATFITGIIQDEVSTIDELTLQVCTPGFEDWLVNVTPAFYEVTDFSSPFYFDIEIMVPEGTEDGEYEFDICLVGDGAEYARQHVVITVVSDDMIEVPFDIHPTSCPNPINRKGKGVLPAAILGTADFDVSQIDRSSIMIEGIVAPVRWSVEDVATPYEPFMDKDLNMMSCNTYGPDGYDDLTLKFENAQIVEELLGDYETGDVVKLTVTGMLLDGTPFSGEDVVVIVR